MAIFKRMKFWKRAENSKTGVVSRILKCFVPCIRRRSRSPSPECKRTTESSHGAEFDGFSAEEIKPGRRIEEEGLRRSDFETIAHLGKGAFGSVVLAKKKSTGGHSSSEKVFALKSVPHVRAFKVEKEVFIRAAGHPFLVQLLAYFQTQESVCYVMEYMEGGTLRSALSRLKRFNEDMTRFYAAEIILAVNFLHNCGIVHRDIKPANILLDRNGHCKLADFGLCIVGMFKGWKASGVCGTVPYMAPEIRRGYSYGPEVDWWSVGCVIFEMMLGDRDVFNYFLNHQQFPKYRLTKDAVSVVKNFLQPDPRRRLGARRNTLSIRKHPFFKTVDWEAVSQKLVTPPLKPQTLETLNVYAADIARKPSMEKRVHEAILEAPLHQQDPLVPEDPHILEDPLLPEDPHIPEEPLVPEDPHILEDPLIPEDPHVPEDPLVPEDPHLLEDPTDLDAIPEHTKKELSSLKEEVEQLKELVRQKDKELEQLYVERRHSTAATGEEGQLLALEENPPHFTLWRKIKLFAGGVFIGLVAFALAMIEIEMKFTERTPK